MGVPKFYRWTSERYPCLSQVIKEYQIPEFDNLYLDMNGIIHVCSHPNDDDPHFRITEAEIFKNIFHYIEVLFRIIKPKRNFFMAVDGVAPRAKMNQQRGRRFRTAKEAEDNIRRALQKGQSLPKEDRFDSNCITPGTEFMTRLNDHLQYFVNKKITSDPLWQGCNVYLSGHDVPGEGEHKIMDFIRHEKSSDGYDANTRHCLYGLDADLMILGLATHEPHFSLLREEVRFGKQSKRVTKPEETTFHLLHLSLMREYLDFEFGALKENISFNYDLERVIDDWVLLGFLVGNDFIPHLPNLHINHDALPYLYRVYIETMPKLDGYLHNGGVLNVQRFQKFLDELAKFDREKFEDIYTDMKWLEGRTGRSLSSGKRGKNGGKVKFSQLLSQMDDDILFPVKNPYMALADVSDAFDDSLATSPPRALDEESGEELEKIFGDMGIKEKDGGEELFEMEFRQHKRAYYTEKFDIPTADDAFISTVVYEYILAIQWILHYYFNGLQSWSWYYPYHYAPFVSDIINTENFDLAMDKGRPFKPFEQLLAVLPSASKKLLPEAFQSLMIMDTSPIIDYYPTSFRTDLNGKQQEWEAVVLIPFIDERRLLTAMAANYARLTDEEKERNSYGACLKYNYSSDISFLYPSTYPGVFPDLDACKASCEKIDKDQFRVEIKDLKKGLCEGVKENVYFPGFPTLKHINHHSNLRKAGVRVFQFSSKSNNMVISIEDTEKPDEDKMRELVGKIVHVEWPYLVEALVTGITDGDVKYVLKEPENIVQEDIMNKNKSEDAKRWMKMIKTANMEKRGVDIGEVKVLVEAKQLKGKRYDCSSRGDITLEREWASCHSFYSYQSIVQNLTVHTSEYQRAFESIEELFPPKSQCFMMACPHYGCSGEVVEVDNESARVRVSLTVPPEPDLSEVITNQEYLTDKYHRTEKVAQRIGISQKMLSRITGNLFIRRNTKNGGEGGERVNLGLKLKFSGRNREVLGYARRDEDGWSFSDSAVNVLRTYVQKFSKIFEKLTYLPEQENYGEEDIFPGKAGKDALAEVLSFLKSLPCAKAETVKCGSNVLDERIVSAIQVAVEESKLQRGSAKYVKVKVKPYVLFKPTAEFGTLVPDPTTEYYLFDRVVNVRNDGTVPLGYRGTIIGVHEVQEDEHNEESPKEIKYEVLFDEPFLGGLMLRCEENKGAYMTASGCLNLSHGERKDAKKRGLTPKAVTKLQGRAEPKSLKRTPSSQQGNSPFSPPRFRDRRYERDGFGSPGDYSSPSSRDRYTPKRSTPLGQRSGGSGRREQNDGAGFQPGYWLKDYGNESPDRGYSPRKAGGSVGNRSTIEKEGKSTPKEVKSDTDFLAMLTKMSKDDDELKSPIEEPVREKDVVRKAEKKESPGEKSKNKRLEEETAMLQKMLGIGTHSQEQNLTSDKSRGPTPDKGRFSSMHTPPRQPNTSVFNQFFSTPPSAHPRMNVPASPTSPLTPGSFAASPTARLQNWCHQNQMPAPNYTYSCTSQGVHAVVRIGPAICYGGQMCQSKPDAAESAAGVALKQLLARQSEVEKNIAAGKHPQASPFFAMQAQSPGQIPFMPPNQMIFNPRLISPRAQQQQQQLHQQHQISPLQRHPAQQQLVMFPGQHPAGYGPHPHNVMNQPHMQASPQRFVQPPGMAPLIMPQHPQAFQGAQAPAAVRNEGTVKSKRDSPSPQSIKPQKDVNVKGKRDSPSPQSIKPQKDVTLKGERDTPSPQGIKGDGALQAGFIPLQVNRAQKANAKKREVEPSRPSTNVAKELEACKESIAPKKVEVAKPKATTDTSPRDVTTQQPTRKSPEAVAADKGMKSVERSSESPKPGKAPKEKAKKKVLLAPSFFAPKK